jgi:hypothetical protein
MKGSVIVGNQRKDKLPERTINIWNRYDFAMCGLGNKCKLIALFKEWGSYNIFLLTLKYMIGTMSIGFLKKRR